MMVYEEGVVKQRLWCNNHFLKINVFLKGQYTHKLGFTTPKNVFMDVCCLHCLK